MWWFTLGCALLILAVLLVQSTKRYPNQPPGPIGLPALGHLLFLGANPLKTFQAWKKKYGSIFFIKFGSWDMVVLCDAKVIREAFAQKALSGRPFIPFFRTPDNTGLGRGDGSKTFEIRKVVFAYLKEHFARYEPLLQDVAHEAVEHLAKRLNEPQSIQHCFDVPQMNLLWKLIFGKEPNHALLLDLLHQLKKSTEIPNAWTLATMFLTWTRNLIPARLTPSNPTMCLNAMTAVVQSAADELRKSHVPNQPRGLVDAFFDQAEKEANPESGLHDQEHLMETLTDIFGAALETTGYTIEWIIYYLASRPEAQRRLQEEIDRVVGPSGIVSLQDKPSMPYADAVIQETLRISSVLPFALFHRATENTQLRGFTIRKDQLVCSHLYGVHLDPDVWENPSSFQPERFLEGGSSFKKLDDIIPFSSGRRFCVGEGAARNELFIVLVTIYQHLDIQLAGLVGKDKPFGFFRRTPDFKVIVTRRTSKI